jgi:hypothetical protein
LPVLWRKDTGRTSQSKEASPQHGGASGPGSARAPLLKCVREQFSCRAACLVRFGGPLAGRLASRTARGSAQDVLEMVVERLWILKGSLRNHGLEQCPEFDVSSGPAWLFGERRQGGHLRMGWWGWGLGLGAGAGADVVMMDARRLTPSLHPAGLLLPRLLLHPAHGHRPRLLRQPLPPVVAGWLRRHLHPPGSPPADLRLPRQLSSTRVFGFALCPARTGHSLPDGAVVATERPSLRVWGERVAASGACAAATHCVDFLWEM